MADTSWIKKKERSEKWITKKKKPKSWITKKEKPKDWITKKKNWITKKPPNPDIRKTLTDAFAGGIKGKPHSSPSGRAASVGRTIKRMGESRAAPKKIKIDSNIVKTKNWPFAKGGDVTRFRSSGPEGKPHSTKEGRSAEAQRAYMRKHGPQEPRRKRIWPKRAKHGIGSLVKKGISKILKPKGVFKPKPKPGKVDQKFLDFIRTGKSVDKHGTKINLNKVVKRLKKQGSPGIETYFESTGKHPKGKATGGRIGLKHGGSVGAAKRGHGAEIK